MVSPTLCPLLMTAAGWKSSVASSGVALSSVTTTLASGATPVLVTTYVKVTLLPASTVSPGAVSASLP